MDHMEELLWILDKDRTMYKRKSRRTWPSSILWGWNATAWAGPPWIRWEAGPLQPRGAGDLQLVAQFGAIHFRSVGGSGIG